MIYSRPDYYKEFQCAAGACEDTCCAGWQIVADQKSLKKYRAVRGTFRKRIREGIDWKEGVFRQDEEKRCAFLNGENLCDLYTSLGREGLCRTCRLYPRHVEEFEGVREISLSLSCPEVAKILMNRIRPVTFPTVETNETEEYGEMEAFDSLFYSVLLDARKAILDILQDRGLSVEARSRLVYGIAHDMQRRVDKRALFTCQEVWKKYERKPAKKFVEKELDEEKKHPEERFEEAKKTFRTMFGLELLRQDWDIQLLETEQFLFLGHTAEEYEKVTEEFCRWIEKTGFPWEIWREQFLVYFIFTYFCGAVYDGQILPKVNMALTGKAVVEEILKTRWLKNGKFLDMEDVVDVVYRFSRELEHSDENLKRMEERNR